VFLARLLFGKPLTLSAFQTWQPRQAAEMEEFHRAIPPVRHTFRLSAVVWGVGLLLEAIVRIPLIYLLPIDVMVGVSTAMMVTVIVGRSGTAGTAAAPVREARAWVQEHHAAA
jgi:hypothetical protein